MLKVSLSSRFKRSYKKYRHNKAVLQELDYVTQLLVARKELPAKYKDHKLSGKMKGIRELHLKPDDLLLYFVIDDEILKLYDIRSHADVFGM